MTPAELAAYLGPALAFAATLAALMFALARMAGAAVDGRHMLTLLLALFFLTLTQHPLPDRGTLDCSGGGVPPVLQPFAMLGTFARLIEDHGFAPRVWIGNKFVQATGMNFLLPAAIGAALARHMGGRHALPRAAAFGLLLSGLAETAQITGLFGLYPCPWRRFLVDDLIVNTAGLTAGFALMRLLRRRRASA